jgi:hypothetical protein
LSKPNPNRTAARYIHSGARAPATGLGRPPPSHNVRTKVVNRRVDLLQDERSRGRISGAAYREGRLAQAVFGRARGPVTSNWSGADRVDAFVARELAVIHGILDAERIVRLVDWMRSELGRIDADILQRVLGENQSYADVATLQGKSGEFGQRYVARRFRDALELLARTRAAAGPAL